MKKTLLLLVLSIFCNQLNLHAGASADTGWGWDEPDVVQHKQSPKESGQQPVAQKPATAKEKALTFLRKYKAYIAAAFGIVALTGGAVVAHKKGWWPFGDSSQADPDKKPEITDITPHLVGLDQFDTKHHDLIKQAMQSTFGFLRQEAELMKQGHSEEGPEVDALWREQWKKDEPLRQKLNEVGLASEERLHRIPEGRLRLSEDQKKYYDFHQLNKTNMIILAKDLDLELLKADATAEQVEQKKQQIQELVFKRLYQKAEEKRKAYNRTAPDDKKLTYEGIMMVDTAEQALALQKFLDVSLEQGKAEYEALHSGKDLVFDDEQLHAAGDALENVGLKKSNITDYILNFHMSSLLVKLYKLNQVDPKPFDVGPENAKEWMSRAETEARKAQNELREPDE